LRESFTAYFVPSALDRILEAENVFNRVQQSEESVRVYVQTVIILSKRLENVDPGTLRFLVSRGFKPHIKGYVLQQQEHCHNLDEAIKAARVAEATSAESAKEMSTSTRQMEENFKALSAKIDGMARNNEEKRFSQFGFRKLSASVDLQHRTVITVGHRTALDKAEAARNHHRDSKTHEDNPKPDSRISSVPDVAQQTADEGPLRCNGENLPTMQQA
jgi:hypothetical protein